jgi:hypothetical protein
MKYAMVVYQGGIGNVFEVECLNLAPFGRNARRLYQGTMDGAALFGRALGSAGVVVRSAHCNEAGDIAGARWSDDLADAPFDPVEVHAN